MKLQSHGMLEINHPHAYTALHHKRSQYDKKIPLFCVTLPDVHQARISFIVVDSPSVFSSFYVPLLLAYMTLCRSVWVACPALCCTAACGFG